MASGPGLLLVAAHPHDDLPAAQFHDWYNNEHGPVRLRLPFVVNGFRYRAREHEKPAWLAIYDIMDVAELGRPTYTDLREPTNKTQREIETMKRIDIDRRIYDRIYSRQARDMRLDESGAVLLTATAEVKPDREQEFNDLYDDEHIPLLTKVPGWLRSRRYRTSSLDGAHPVEYIAVHEFEETNGIGGPEFNATMTPAFAEILSNGLTSLKALYWTLAYTFGPAPRELGALADTSTSEFASRDGRTRTYPDPSAPAIESYVTTADGVDLTYRLEGAAAADAPLIVLVNSILVDWTIWNGFVAAFLVEASCRKYRILRYNARGRTSKSGTQQVSLDLLTQDLFAIFDALRIDHVACAIGVSLGGATVLNSALKNSTRIPAFVACDTNDAAPASNPTAWGERIATAEREGTTTHDGEGIVGQQLAEQTVQRWFVEASLSSKKKEVDRVRALVQHNSLAGFRTAVRALYSYNLRDQMASGRAHALFVAGDGDGVLPKTMQDMAQRYGDGKASSLELIPNAGHLPMVEQPEAFTAAIARFLS